MLDLKRAESTGLSNWKTDLSVLVLWYFWFCFMVGFEMPKYFSVIGLSLVLVYGSWLWTIRRASFFLLLVAWVYGVSSLAPTGLIWLSLFMSFLILKAIQFRVMVKNSFQFAILCFVGNIILLLFERAFLSFSYADSFWNFFLIGSLLIRSFSEAFLAYIFFKPLNYFVGAK